jgi:CheY-like chemotaxis protein
VEIEELPEEPTSDDYHEKCPECGSDIGVMFCGSCGTSLSKKRPRATPKKRTNKILVAEDSAATRTAISNMLKRMGCEVIIALNGEEAVELALEEQPSLILMDIMMPVMDGITALKEIRSDVSMRTTPVVMLTSVTDIRLVTEAIECGANDYIAKPFSVTLLTERVERYVHAR